MTLNTNVHLLRKFQCQSTCP